MPPSVRSRGYLPHWETANAIYFVTFRLADSLPRELVFQLRRERQAIENASQTGTSTAADTARLHKLRTILKKAERCLDDGLGECRMRDPGIAQTVADAIRHFEGKRYRLMAWCVMPNHVHVVFSPMGAHTLQAILHSWKSFSAQAANKRLGRTGAFWQREYFDHLVRNEASLAKIVRYVQNNPRRAGLRDWPWVEVISDRGLFRTAGF
ncbi:MAG TPA: transposase [Candidatus Acidoferrales bacterium]|nr:transposase [Candidatus Acidoferrales bacterium]